MLASIPIILEPVPIQKLSKERAIAKNKASLGSIVLEWLKSEEIGLLKILKSFLIVRKAS